MVCGLSLLYFVFWTSESQCRVVWMLAWEIQLTMAEYIFYYILYSPKISQIIQIDLKAPKWIHMYSLMPWLFSELEPSQKWYPTAVATIFLFAITSKWVLKRHIILHACICTITCQHNSVTVNYCQGKNKSIFCKKLVKVIFVIKLCSLPLKSRFSPQWLKYSCPDLNSCL